VSEIKIIWTRYYCAIDNNKLLLLQLLKQCLIVRYNLIFDIFVDEEREVINVFTE